MPSIRPARRDPRIPGVALEPLLAEPKERRPFAGAERGENCVSVGRKIRAGLPLDHADDRPIDEVRERAVLDDEIGAAALEDVDRELRLGRAHRVL